MRWVYIENTDNKYKLYEDGRVWTCKRHKFLNPVLYRGPYCYSLYVNEKLRNIQVIGRVYKAFGIELSRRILGVFSKEELRERHRLNQARYRKEDPEKHRKLNEVSYRKAVLSINDSYVRNNLAGTKHGIPKEFITKELIETQRKSIWLHRKLKQSM